jgi:hypothetical protein
LLCLGRRTVTGLLSTSGQQFRDWSAAYRLFSRNRIPVDSLFTGARRAAAARIPDSQPLCLAVDDSLFPRSGLKIPGVGWRRDPLGPKFQTNFIRAQRFLQFSLAVPVSGPSPTMRLIPVDFLHCPTPAKPGKKASAEELNQYRKDGRAHTITAQASSRLASLCARLPSDSHGHPRPVHLLADGQYTNHTTLHHLPPRTTFIGRIRKDAKLHYQPPATTATHRGRPLRYGPVAPTPEQVRTDEAHPWATVSVFAAGVHHQGRVKTVTNLLWRPAGPAHLLKLVVIAPIHYRPRAGAKLLYRQPAFLICTDPSLDTQQIVQQCFWRWDIEVNFREEKSLLGVADAQVRTPNSNDSLPAFRIATFALFHLAALDAASQGGNVSALPPPKWSAAVQPQRPSTQRLLHHLRAEVWGRGLGLDTNFSHFATRSQPTVKPEKFYPSLSSALLYCNA